jgi:hypothetical protein
MRRTHKYADGGKIRSSKTDADFDGPTSQLSDHHWKRMYDGPFKKGDRTKRYMYGDTLVNAHDDAKRANKNLRAGMKIRAPKKPRRAK